MKVISHFVGYELLDFVCLLQLSTSCVHAIDLLRLFSRLELDGLGRLKVLNEVFSLLLWTYILVHKSERRAARGNRVTHCGHFNSTSEA